MAGPAGLERDAASVCPRDQGPSAARVIGEPFVLTIGQPMHVKMVLGDIDTDNGLVHLIPAFACHADLKCPCVRSGLGKGEDDQTL